MIVDTLVAVTGRNAVVVSHWIVNGSFLLVVVALGYMVIQSRRP